MPSSGIVATVPLPFPQPLLFQEVSSDPSYPGKSPSEPQNVALNLQLGSLRRK